MWPHDSSPELCWQPVKKDLTTIALVTSKDYDCLFFNQRTQVFSINYRKEAFKRKCLKELLRGNWTNIDKIRGFLEFRLLFSKGNLFRAIYSLKF